MQLRPHKALNGIVFYGRSSSATLHRTFLPQFRRGWNAIANIAVQHKASELVITDAYPVIRPLVLSIIPWPLRRGYTTSRRVTYYPVKYFFRVLLVSASCATARLPEARCYSRQRKVRWRRLLLHKTAFVYAPIIAIECFLC